MNTIECKLTVDNWFLRRKGFGKILQKCNSYYVYRLKFNYYCKLCDWEQNIYQSCDRYFQELSWMQFMVLGITFKAPLGSSSGD